MNFEILAPAGSWDALIAGVRCGADAVYFGTKSLNARQNAGNFIDEEFEKAIFYCLSHNVKPYITINTVCKDSEFQIAYNIVKTALSCGANVFIVQDLGIAKMIKSIFPDAALHASTQMSITSPAGAKAIEKLGFSQVVVARELNKEEICDIAKSTNMTIETFVHGALCMSVSGQCYLSSMIGGRSGNRGLCAQPCRLPFSTKNDNFCGLSLKDLSLIKHLNELNECGVKCLKIEGRMKGPEYVAATVTALKNAINNELSFRDEKMLSEVFNRSGFTSSYFDSSLKEMFGTRKNENIEESISIRTELQKLYEKEKQTVPLDMHCIIKGGEESVLKVSSPFKNIIVYGSIPQKAINKSLTKDIARKQLSKLGGTQFYLNNLEIEIEDGITLSASQLNDLRRQAIEKLNSFKKASINTISIDNSNKPPLHGTHDRYLTARFSSVTQIPYDNPFKHIFIPLESNTDDFKRLNVGVEIPRAFFGSENIIIDKLVELKELGVTDALCGSIAGYTIAKKLGYNVFGDFGLNVFNSVSGNMIDNPIVSFELSLNEINELECDSKGAIVYGFLPLMLTKNCPVKNEIGCTECKKENKMNSYLTDRTGRKFLIKCSKYGYSEMFNSVPLYMADKLNDINASFFHFYFTNENLSQVKKIIKMFKNKESADFEFTRGHYYKKAL